MDFPEVWAFKQKHRIVKLEHFQSIDDVAIKLTSKFPPARMVSILMPEAETSGFESIISDSDYYSCDHFKLSDVLTKTFVDGFLKFGEFTCVSMNAANASSDFDDAFYVVNNKLKLRLHKDSLHSIGAVELTSLKHRLDDDDFFYYDDIDLLNGKLKLSKLQEELKDVFPDSPLAFMWCPNTSDICPSSIAKHFSDTGRTIKLCKNKLINRNEYGLKFPQIPPKMEGDDFSEISEYIGMAILGCDMEPNDYSSYQLPDDCIEIGRGRMIQCKGVIVQSTIKHLLNEAQGILKTNSSFPWIALSVTFHAETTAKLLIVSHDKIVSV